MLLDPIADDVAGEQEGQGIPGYDSKQSKQRSPPRPENRTRGKSEAEHHARQRQGQASNIEEDEAHRERHRVALPHLDKRTGVALDGLHPQMILQTERQKQSDACNKDQQDQRSPARHASFSRASLLRFTIAFS